MVRGRPTHKIEEVIHVSLELYHITLEQLVDGHREFDKELFDSWQQSMIPVEDLAEKFLRGWRMRTINDSMRQKFPIGCKQAVEHMCDQIMPVPVGDCHFQGSYALEVQGMLLKAMERLLKLEYTCHATIPNKNLIGRDGLDTHRWVVGLGLLN